jgi:hypothetical protein
MILGTESVTHACMICAHAVSRIGAMELYGFYTDEPTDTKINVEKYTFLLVLLMLKWCGLCWCPHPPLCVARRPLYWRRCWAGRRVPAANRCTLVVSSVSASTCPVFGVSFQCIGSRHQTDRPALTGKTFIYFGPEPLRFSSSALGIEHALG